MEYFDEAYKRTLGHEGGTANNRFDPGGFTYYGIARNRWPTWEGWKYVDDDVKQFGRPRPILDSPILGKLVKDFYYVNFWQVIKCDKVALRSPSVALELFDTGVNIGTGAAAMLLQRTLNLMNRRATLWRDIKVDGAIGPITLEAVEECLKKRGERRLYRILNFGQGKHYWDLMEKNPDKFEEFIGWFDRVECEPPL